MGVGQKSELDKDLRRDNGRGKKSLMVEYDTIKALGWGLVLGIPFRSWDIEGMLLEVGDNQDLPSAFPCYTDYSLGTSEQGTGQALWLELLVPVSAVDYIN